MLIGDVPNPLQQANGIGIRLMRRRPGPRSQVEGDTIDLRAETLGAKAHSRRHHEDAGSISFMTKFCQLMRSLPP